jgi:hypothetical protein
MIVQKRIANTKRHTVGYIVGGRRVTRGKAVKLARRGKLHNVTAKRGPDGWYITALPSSEMTLYELPVNVE